MTRLAKASIVLLALAACGPGAKTSPVIPTLPGDGSANTAAPKAPADNGNKGADDPWAGREGLIDAPPPIIPRALDLPRVDAFTLPNGLKVVAVEMHQTPMVSVQLAVRAGRVDATRDKMGIEQVVARALLAGTSHRTADQLTAVLDPVGAAIHAQSSYENTLISCQARADSWQACLDVIPDVVAHPSFPKDAVDAARLELAQAAAARRKDPSQLAALHFQNLLWGDAHVRGWAASQRTVDSITRKNVVAWHKKYFVPQNAVLAVAGNIDGKRLEARLRRAFRTWRKRGRVPARKTYKVPDRQRLRARVVDWPGMQVAYIRVGNEGLKHTDPDFYKAVVFNEILGGDVGSRLSRRLAQTGGGQAQGSSGFDRNFDVGLYVVSAAAPAADAAATVRAILHEMKALGDAPPSQSELALAVTHAIGQYLLSMETSAELGNAVLAAALHGMKADSLRDYPLALGKVTPEQAKAAAARILDPLAPAMVIVGDAKKIGPQLTAIGISFDTVKHSDPVGGWERAPKPEHSKEAVAKASKILAKALEAKGGAAALRGMKTMILEGDAKGVIRDPKSGTQKFTAHVRRTFVTPDHMRRDIARDVGGQKAVSGIVLAGNQAWAFEQRGNKQGAGELPAELVEALKQQLWRDPGRILLRHLDKGTTAVALPDQKVEGHPCYVVQVRRADGLASTLFFDKKTYLLRRQSYRSEDSSAVETYDDYKTVGGLAVAHHRVTTEGPTQFDMTITNVKFNVNVPASLFEKPKK